MPQLLGYDYLIQLACFIITYLTLYGFMRYVLVRVMTAMYARRFMNVILAQPVTLKKEENK